MIDIPSPGGSVQEFDSVLGSNPENRLVLLYQTAQSGLGSNFYELRWLYKREDKWEIFRVVSNEQFQANSTCKRWLSELHSFDSNSGIAIVKVGEADAPHPQFKVNYYWAFYNLNDTHLEMLNRCSDPFEEYTG